MVLSFTYLTTVMRKEKKINTPQSKNNSSASSDEDYQNMISHFHDNLENFMSVNNLSANSLAAKLGCSEKTISTYKISKKIADPKILGKLKKEFDISLDDFLFRKMSEAELARNDDFFNMMKYYEGLYIIYYLCTESFKGIENKEASEALRYGILYIYESQAHKSDTHLECSAVLGIEDRQELKMLYTNCQQNPQSAIENHNPDRSYRGQLRLDNDHYYLTLSHNNENVLMIGYSIKNQKKRTYIGGLVTINSVSRGRENAPVLQLAGLSKYFLDCNDEEMEAALHMSYKIELVDEADRIYEFIKNPPGHSINSKEHHLNEEQLKAIITADIEYEIRRIIEKRVYHHYKLISSEDNLFYHYLKTRLKGPKDDSYGKGKY